MLSKDVFLIITKSSKDIDEISTTSFDSGEVNDGVLALVCGHDQQLQYTSIS